MSGHQNQQQEPSASPPCTGTGTGTPVPCTEWSRWRAASVSARRRQLEEQLGSRCCRCGEQLAPLHFHHPSRKDWRSRDKSWGSRLAHYRRDLLSGNLELVCETCHSEIHRGNLPRRAPAEARITVPF